MSYQDKLSDRLPDICLQESQSAIQGEQKFVVTAAPWPMFWHKANLDHKAKDSAKTRSKPKNLIVARRNPITA